MAQEFGQDLFQVQQARLAVNQGHHIDTEAVLQLGQFVELVQNDFGIFIAFQFDHDTHTGFIGLVAQVGYAFQRFFAYQLADFLNQLGFVYLIWDFIDNNGFAFTVFTDRLDMGFTAHYYAAAAGFIAFSNAAQTVNSRTCWEIGRLDNVDQLVDFSFRLIQQTQAGIDGIAQIVWRNIGCHTDGNTGRTVYQQSRETGRQYQRLMFAAVIVGAEINGFFLDIRQHFMGNFFHADFGITHGCCGQAVNRTEVALTVDQHITHGKVLRHADDGVVNSYIAVRVVFTDNIADDTRRFFIGGIPVVFQLVHRVQHAAVYRLETVADIRQGSTHNHAHGVIEVALAHFVFKADRQGFKCKFMVVADGCVGHDYL